VMLSGYSEGPNVADTVIEAEDDSLLHRTLFKGLN
jgi:hypothetical protein